MGLFLGLENDPRCSFRSRGANSSRFFCDYLGIALEVLHLGKHISPRKLVQLVILFPSGWRLLLRKKRPWWGFVPLLALASVLQACTSKESFLQTLALPPILLITTQSGSWRRACHWLQTWVCSFQVFSLFMPAFSNSPKVGWILMICPHPGLVFLLGPAAGVPACLFHLSWKAPVFS